MSCSYSPFIFFTPPQQVLGTLGRFDELKASGRLDALMRSGLRHCEKFAVIDAHAAGQTEPVAVRCIGPDLVFARLWKESGIPEALQSILKARRYEFDVQRATPKNSIFIIFIGRWHF